MRESRYLYVPRYFPSYDRRTADRATLGTSFPPELMQGDFPVTFGPGRLAECLVLEWRMTVRELRPASPFRYV